MAMTEALDPAAELGTEALDDALDSARPPPASQPSRPAYPAGRVGDPAGDGD